MSKWLVVAEVPYAWNLGLTKLSLLLMYYRIFRHEYFKKMAWVVGVFVWVWKLWYPGIAGHCIDQVGTWISNAGSTILTDLVILIMPIPQIWKLQLRMAEKIGLTLAFSLGSLREANAPPTVGGTGGSKDGYRSGSATLSSFTSRTDDDAMDNAAENPLCGLRDSAESGSVVSHHVGLRAITTDNASGPTLRIDTLGYGHSTTSYTVTTCHYRVF
ncbi:hypothetical protein E4U43_000510 [Claviceps pusilla]|uniref:Rhodopsin domain-containing protein n=1 Tax=Claviceps pusilla TaxID=123648 RepID=A0A9P7NGB6_9HYPO|nr:hypothetical protein E4U43_000510 [Claviceps pusilla]